jgi:hypothetical protein
MPRHFFIAGAQRCATTYLYRMLDQHPDICMARPIRPEPKYFLRDAPGDMDVYRQALFTRPDAACLGEKSTSYIERVDAADRIANAIPDATIVFVLRDPVERAISNHRFSVMHGLEPLSFEAALEAEDSRDAHVEGVSVSPFAYFRRGLYAGQLAAWRDRFPASQIRLLTTEHLVADTARVMRSLFEHLGVDPAIPLADIGSPVNATNGSSDVASEVRQRLQQAYRGPNRALADSYGVDISAWQ